MRGKTDEEEESGLLQAREKHKQVSMLPALCGTPWAVHIKGQEHKGQHRSETRCPLP